MEKDSPVPEAKDLVVMADANLVAVLGGGTVEICNAMGASVTYLCFFMRAIAILRKHNKEALRLAFAEFLGNFDYIERNLLFDGLSWAGSFDKSLATHTLKEIISKCDTSQCDKQERCRILILINALDDIEDTEEIVALFAEIWAIINAMPAALAKHHMEERELPQR